jgi:hypothetical protein
VVGRVDTPAQSEIAPSHGQHHEGNEAQQAVPAQPAPDSAVVRKARRLLPDLPAATAARLRELLDAVERADSPAQRSLAEDALLDLFLDLDSGPDPAKEERPSPR